jgi:Flp pilus assembly pilin Flp
MRHKQTRAGSGLGAPDERGGGVYSIIRRLARQRDDAGDSGQALVEYALILMFVVLLAVTALESIGIGVAGHLSDAADGLGGE